MNKVIFILIILFLLLIIIKLKKSSKIHKLNSNKDIINIIKFAVTNNKKILILSSMNKSSSHNKNNVFLSEKYINICLNKFNKIINLDIKNKLLTVQSNCTWFQLVKFLDKYNLTPRTTQAGLHFTVAGSICSNIHSKKIKSSMLIDSVKQIKYINGLGNIVIVNEFTNEFKAFFGSMGLLGIIIEVTIYLEPNYSLEYKKLPIKRTQIFNKIMNVINDEHLYTVNFYPSSLLNYDKAVLLLSYKKGICKKEKFDHNKYYKNSTFFFTISVIFAEIVHKILKKDDAIKFIYNQELKMYNVQNKCYNNRFEEWDLPFHRRVEVNDIIIPFNDKLSDNIVNIVNIVKKYNLFLGLSCRLIQMKNKYSNTYLSYVPDNKLYFGGVLNYIRKDNYKLFLKELESYMIKNNIHYHLCYDNDISKNTFRKLYPEYKKFLKLKEKTDPHNVFINSFFNDYLK